MEDRQGRSIDPPDLKRAVCSVAEHFETDVVHVIGSQALLVFTDDVARELRFSPEIDLYPSNRREWEARGEGRLASEEIFGLFGDGSHFHEAHGFFIDGVDETTARLPPNWADHAPTRRFECASGKTVTAIAPAPNDLVAAKLVRGEEKDIVFAANCLRTGLARPTRIRKALEAMLEGEELKRCLAKLDQAKRLSRDRRPESATLLETEVERYLGARSEDRG
jgi:hypothetical protein